jgi:hypothetical protein
MYISTKYNVCIRERLSELREMPVKASRKNNSRYVQNIISHHMHRSVLKFGSVILETEPFLVRNQLEWYRCWSIFIKPIS